MGQSVETRTSYANKYGVGQAKVILERVQSAANGTGIDFTFDGRIGNTRDVHRLIMLAGREQDNRTDLQRVTHSVGLQTRVAEELFTAYFERGQNIVDHEILKAAAMRAGLEGRKVVETLASDRYIEEVTRESEDTRNEGISGVPNFTINDDFEVEGAQEPAAFLMLFRRLKNREGRI